MKPIPPATASSCDCAPGACASDQKRETVFWLQGITLAWMVAECSLSLYAAVAARSPVLLAFGSDSLVELLSASAVLLQFLPRKPLSERVAAHINGALLIAMAVIVCGTSLASLLLGFEPGESRLGIAVAIAALIVMPVLAKLKRREAMRRENDALAADAVQSAACAYLALITLAGLGVHAVFGIAWFDSLAALAAVPLLIQQGRLVWQGEACGCC